MKRQSYPISTSHLPNLSFSPTVFVGFRNCGWEGRGMGGGARWAARRARTRAGVYARAHGRPGRWSPGGTARPSSVRAVVGGRYVSAMLGSGVDGLRLARQRDCWRATEQSRFAPRLLARESTVWLGGAVAGKSPCSVCEAAGCRGVRALLVAVVACWWWQMTTRNRTTAIAWIESWHLQMKNLSSIPAACHP